MTSNHTADNDCPDRLPHPWQDTTSYARNSKDRAPRTWTVKLGRFALVVTRHFSCAPDVWVCHCYPLWERRELASKKLREAACQAKAMLQVELETVISELAKLDVNPKIATQPRPSQGKEHEQIIK
jgi:hypothetical protein